MRALILFSLSAVAFGTPVNFHVVSMTTSSMATCSIGSYQVTDPSLCSLAEGNPFAPHVLAEASTQILEAITAPRYEFGVGINAVVLVSTQGCLDVDLCMHTPAHAFSEVALTMTFLTDGQPRSGFA